MMRHICISIDGALRTPKGDLEGVLSDEDKEYSDAEVRAFLTEKKAEGFTVWAGCDNMDETGRCQGHPDETE